MIERLDLVELRESNDEKRATNLAEIAERQARIEEDIYAYDDRLRAEAAQERRQKTEAEARTAQNDEAAGLVLKWIETAVLDDPPQADASKEASPFDERQLDMLAEVFNLERKHHEREQKRALEPLQRQNMQLKQEIATIMRLLMARSSRPAAPHEDELRRELRQLNDKIERISTVDGAVLSELQSRIAWLEGTVGTKLRDLSALADAHGLLPRRYDALE
jgi:hypothetical protein